MKKGTTYIDESGIKWKAIQVFPDGCVLIKSVTGSKTICKEDFGIFTEC